MDIRVGRPIALAVNRAWYEAIAHHQFLKRLPPADSPSVMVLATVEDIGGQQGVWVKPDGRFSEFPSGSLFIPWSAIVAALLPGPDDDKTLGFARSEF